MALESNRNVDHEFSAKINRLIVHIVVFDLTIGRSLIVRKVSAVIDYIMTRPREVIVLNTYIYLRSQHGLHEVIETAQVHILSTTVYCNETTSNYYVVRIRACNPIYRVLHTKQYW